MKNLTIIFLFCLTTACSVSSNNKPPETQSTEVFQSRFSTNKLKDAPVKLFPFPQEVEWRKNKFEIRSLKILNPEKLDNNTISALKRISDEFGIQISSEGKYVLQYRENTNLPKESYLLEISNKLISIESSSDKGLFYSLQTIRQLIDKQNDKIRIQNCLIKDYPEHSIRGFMLDVGRNYQSIGSLKKQLDIMARYKLNVFHWHLTDKPAWRIESHIYPELTAAANHRPTRDPGKFYSYNEIRELIDYARNLNIQIIPEIDMPGHSDSFVTSMGVKMESKEGMEILENVLKEFFSEITVEDCPIIHLGSDEVLIPEPDLFIVKMVDICEDHGRKVMIWNPGLKAHNGVIRQTWQARHLEQGNYQEVDSWNNYVNNDDPHNIVSKLFFKPIGFGSENEVIGSILCLWPDVNLDNGEDAFRFNPLYPALLTHAWTCWTADVTVPYPYYLTRLPDLGSNAAEYFEAFEDYILDHQEKYFADIPFPYFRQSDKSWRIALADSSTDESELVWIPARGNTLIFKDRFKLGGPEWEHPGWKPSKSSGWGSPEDQEIPWRDEEFYWTRKPVKISLKKGDNTIRIMAPYTHDFQNWMISFVVMD